MLFFALPVAYVLIFATRGISDVDEGFVLAGAWRVVRGEIPYLDFASARPPLSILLHALPLLVVPSALQVLAGRIGFYLFVAATSLVSTDALLRVFRGDPDARAIDRYLLASASFVFSAHDFPPMAWHTVDGLLFAAVGVALLARGGGAVTLALGSLSLVLAALSKQSFYPVALLGPVFAGLLHGRGAALGAALWIGLGISAVLAGLALTGLLPAFLAQTTQPLGRGGGFAASGIAPYLNCSPAQVLVALAFGFAAARLGARRGWHVDPGLAVAVGIAALFATALARAFAPANRPFLPLASSYNPQVAMWLGAYVAASALVRGRRAEGLVLAALLFVGWCSGISYGRQGPSLFAAPLLFALLYFSAAQLRARHVPVLQWLLAVGGAVTFALVYLHGPHGRDTVAGLPSLPLDGLAPKLSHLRASPEAEARWRELVAARARYGDRLAVLPGIPLAHFALGIDNPLPLDLLNPVELAGQRAWVERALATRAEYALVERAAARPDGSYELDVVERVRTGWPRVESLRSFDVYRNPAHSAAAGDGHSRSGKQPPASQSPNEP